MRSDRDPARSNHDGMQGLWPPVHRPTSCDGARWSSAVCDPPRLRSAVHSRRAVLCRRRRRTDRAAYRRTGPEAPQITSLPRRAICERFPAGRERRAWITWAATVPLRAAWASQRPRPPRPSFRTASTAAVARAPRASFSTPPGAPEPRARFRALPRTRRPRAPGTARSSRRTF
jgi:hypothetical protein